MCQVFPSYSEEEVSSNITVVRIKRMVTCKTAALAFLGNDEMQAMTMYPGLVSCFMEAVDHMENK